MSGDLEKTAARIAGKTWGGHWISGEGISAEARAEAQRILNAEARRVLLDRRRVLAQETLEEEFGDEGAA